MTKAIVDLVVRSHFSSDFKPELMPEKMLELGVLSA